MLRCMLKRKSLWRRLGLSLSRQSRLFEEFKACSVKAVTYRHLVHTKNVPCFSVQSSISSMFNQEFLRNYAKKRASRTPEDEDIHASEVSNAEEEEDDHDDGQNEVDHGCKIVMKTVPSLRLDSILKTGLGTSKKTVEKDFYAGKIRINGEKVTKKSTPVEVSDEIDVVKEIFPENENFLVVNRVVVKSIGNITPAAQFPVKLQMFKELVIENYEDKWP